MEFFRLCTTDRNEARRRLRSNEELDLAYASPNGATILHILAEDNDVDFANLIFSRTTSNLVDIYSTDMSISPLDIATKCKNDEMVRVFIDNSFPVLPHHFDYPSPHTDLFLRGLSTQNVLRALCVRPMLRSSPGFLQYIQTACTECILCMIAEIAIAQRNDKVLNTVLRIHVARARDAGCDAVMWDTAKSDYRISERRLTELLAGLLGLINMTRSSSNAGMVECMMTLLHLGANPFDTLSFPNSMDTSARSPFELAMTDGFNRTRSGWKDDGVNDDTIFALLEWCTKNMRSNLVEDGYYLAMSAFIDRRVEIFSALIRAGVNTNYCRGTTRVRLEHHPIIFKMIDHLLKFQIGDRKVQIDDRYLAMIDTLMYTDIKPWDYIDRELNSPMVYARIGHKSGFRRDTNVEDYVFDTSINGATITYPNRRRLIIHMNTFVHRMTLAKLALFSLQ